MISRARARAHTSSKRTAKLERRRVKRCRLTFQDYSVPQALRFYFIHGRARVAPCFPQISFARTSHGLRGAKKVPGFSRKGTKRFIYLSHEKEGRKLFHPLFSFFLDGGNVATDVTDLDNNSEIEIRKDKDLGKIVDTLSYNFIHIVSRCSKMRSQRVYLRTQRATVV